MTGYAHILALDPAKVTGAAHSSGYLDVWRIGQHESEHRGKQFARMRRNIHDIARTLGIDFIAFEDAAAGSHKWNTQRFHNQLAGIVILCAAELEVPFRTYKPNTIKKFATGNGRADKSQMIASAQQQLGINPPDDNAADALWILELAKREQA